MKKIEIIEDKLYDVLPIKNTVLFPGVLMPVAVSRPKSLKLIRAANESDEPLIVLTQRDNNTEDPTEMISMLSVRSPM
jgi:ATP-dependent Lon protease